MRVLRTESAEADLDAIVDHYGPLNPIATLAMLDRIAEAESLLTRYPRLGRPGRIADTREMVVTHTPFISHQQWPQSHRLA